MATFFGDCQPAGTSYYANVVKQLWDAIEEKRRGKLAPGVILLHDKAPVHKSRVAQVQAVKSPAIQCSPQAPSDYHLFRNLKSLISGR